MPLLLSMNAIDNKFSNFALVRKQIAYNLDANKIEIGRVKLQNSGILTLVGSIALMIFSTILHPLFGALFLLTGVTFFSISCISSLKEVISSFPIKNIELSPQGKEKYSSIRALLLAAYN
ncbi:MAG: hypothetical protein K1060chlam1_00473 [Candidatus Anoxychlamydiales bacterium]|nr:hypothetical protein [Candidatus Anoxychlamydiales bacterium]